MRYNLIMFKCPRCDREFCWAAKLEKHIVAEHGLDPEALYIETQCAGGVPQCGCGCLSKIPWNGWKLGFSSKFLRGHNASSQGNFSNPEIHAAAQATRVSNIRSGKTKIWNAGKTKETDESLARASIKKSATMREGYASGRIKAHWLGKTKETCDALARGSATKKRNFLEGVSKVWNEGLTRETSEKLAGIGDRISHTRVTNYDSATRYTREDVTKIAEEAGFELLSNPDDYRNKYQLLHVRCLEKGHDSQRNVMMLQNTPKCLICHPKESCAQLELSAFVRSLGVEVYESTRQVIPPREIDVYCPTHKFGIEFNGLFFHTDATKHSLYHEEKTDAAASVGVRLFHVFEDEWRDKRRIVESMVRARLGIAPRRVFARKCVVKEITPEVRREFFERTHIDGDARATIAWGLFLGNELLSVISLRKPIRKSLGVTVFELARYSSELNTSVVGGLGKLLALCKLWLRGRGVRVLMTYVDKRHGDGHGYERLGFACVGITGSPRFWWTGGEVGPNRVDRLTYRADSERGLTEKQVAEDAGVNRIYGCTNKVYELSID